MARHFLLRRQSPDLMSGGAQVVKYATLREKDHFAIAHGNGYLSLFCVKKQHFRPAAGIAVFRAAKRNMRPFHSRGVVALEFQM